MNSLIILKIIFLLFKFYYFLKIVLNTRKPQIQACMDQEMLEQRGIQPLVNILETYGGWPVVRGDAWQSNNWNWMEINQKISNDGLEDALLFSMSVTPDQKNSTQRILDVGVYESYSLFVELFI